MPEIDKIDKIFWAEDYSNICLKLNNDNNFKHKSFDWIGTEYFSNKSKYDISNEEKFIEFLEFVSKHSDSTSTKINQFKIYIDSTWYDCDVKEYLNEIVTIPGVKFINLEIIKETVKTDPSTFSYSFYLNYTINDKLTDKVEILQFISNEIIANNNQVDYPTAKPGSWYPKVILKMEWIFSYYDEKN